MRHWCSSRYLRISPLHREFHRPLTASSRCVYRDLAVITTALSHGTSPTTCPPFTPNKSGQRSTPTYYRGCWHVVSRALFRWYRQYSSHRKGVYNPKAVILHAALLGQACAHCRKFLAAAPRRSLGRVSVPVCRVVLSDPEPITALVRHYHTNKLMGRGPCPARLAAFLTVNGGRMRD